MTKRMKLIALTVAVILVGTAAAVAVTFGMKRGTAVAAIVNGETIYADELNTEVAAVAKQYNISLEGADGAKQRAEISKILLDQLIDQRLILQEARRQNVVATDAQIQKQVDEIKKNFPTDAEFQAALAQRGLTMTTLRDRIRTTITVQNIVSKLPVPAPSNAAVEKYFREHRAEFDQAEQIRVRHILVESAAEARLVLARLDRGDKFEDLARQYSKDPGSKDSGGDLGFQSRGALVPEFEKVAFALKPGQRSGPVKTQYGYHIIQLIEIKPAKAATLTAAIREQIRNKLLGSVREKAFAEWLKQVKAKAEIKRFTLATQ
ncbi:MAG TPA: peptidylprolyl isomerase [bacterium]|jgi:foldase protein PrsA|nr:peptidylprolyl isomerase [bacterium]